MTSPAQAQVRNRLLSLMEPDDFERLAPHLEYEQCGKGAILTQPDDQIDHAYFLEGGVGSIIVVSPEGLAAEAGLFGREGMSPTALVLGSNTSDHRILIQVSDDTWRIAKAPFLAAVSASPTLQGLLLRYAQTLSVQVACTALSNAVHPIDERLARWILMCDDRLDGRDLGLTHEFLSVMLAVRRPSVTTALHVLEGNGFIRAERGNLIVLDRQGLEEFASDGYGRPEATYRHLIGAMS